MEGQGFRDEFQSFEKQGVAIIGMSADPPAKQRKFAEKYAFPFPLLCDESHATLQAYHAWGPKKFMGQEYEGIHRITYVIDEEGRIARAYPKVKVKAHAQEVLQDLSG